MALYRLKDGSHTRGEGGKKVRYKAGTDSDVLSLSAAEYEALKARVEPLGGNAPAPEPVVKEKRAKAKEPEPAKVEEPPAPAAPEPEVEPEPAVRDPEAAAEPEAPPEPAAETPVALAGNVGKAQKAIAKITDAAELDALAAAEKAGKNRSSVSKAIEERRKELN